MDNSIRLSNSVPIPIIVAPSHLKFIGLQNIDTYQGGGYLNTNSVISDIWTNMKSKMKDAKALVFIGYSFTEADLYFSSVLRTVLTNSTRQVKIILVNPDAQRISERLSRRFAIEPVNIQSHFDF